MLPAPLPTDDAARPAVRDDPGSTETAPPLGLDALVRAASLACGTPVALIHLVDGPCHWFRIDNDGPDIAGLLPADPFCIHARAAEALVEVEDARFDIRYWDAPLVAGEPHIRFYAGVALRLADGTTAGALCLLDTQPRRLDDMQRALLTSLGQAASAACGRERTLRLQIDTARGLHAGEEQLRRLYEATPAMLHATDEGGVLLMVSDTWLARLGYARDEVVGRPFAAFLSPRSRRRSLDLAMLHVAASDVCDSVEYELIRQDGTVLEVLLSTILDAGGEAGAARRLTLLDDATARRRAERMLTEEHRRSSSIIESTGMGTWEWNVQTDLLRCNQHWAGNLGWTLEDLAPLSSRTWHDRTHPDDLTRVAEQLQQHLAGETRQYDVEFRVRHRDGRWVWVQDRGTVVSWTEHGQPEWMIGARHDVSRHKQQEEALRKSEEFLDRTGRVAGVGGWDLDLVTGDLYWSPETYRIIGAPLAYRPTLDVALSLYPPDSRSLIETAIARSTASGEPWDLELACSRWDGTPIWVRAVGSVTFAEDRPVRLSGAFQDVTDQVARRHALQQASERVKLATDSGGIGIWDWDIANGTMTWDARMYQIHGLEPGGGVEPFALWNQRLHPDDRRAAEEAVQDGVAGLKPFDTEFRIVWDDGSVHHIRGAGRVTRDSVGNPLRMVGVNWDVTESRVMAAELARQAELQAEASERERAVFRNNPDSLSIIRVEEEDGRRIFRFETVSPSVINVTGIRAEDLIGQRVGSGLSPEAAQAMLRSCEDCVEQEQTTTFSLTLATPRGVRAFEGARTPIRHPGTGKIVRLASSMRDVTERNRLEVAAHHGQKMEAIGRLAAGVAHDFNNILQSISGSLEMAQDEAPAGTALHEFTSIGLRAARRGSYLTHHLLSYARKQTLQPRLVELPLLLFDIEQLLGRTLGSNITVAVRVDSTAPAVRVDPGQIQTALLNLAINASHAMADGGSLVIAVHTVAEPARSWVVIEVTDTGTGMDAETLARAMEPFFTTKGLKGTGLGLSMVQGFAEQSGGSLSIRSVQGEGTTVALRLPSAADGRVNTVQPPQPQKPIGRVLLVDDDPDVLVTTGAFLEKAGFLTIRAASANAALALLADGTAIDAVVTDYAMPGMNGADLVAELRLTRPRLPALVISGFTDLADSSALGEDVVMMRKPFQRDTLLGTLRRLVGRPLEMDELYESLRPRLDEP